jgi:hypothetical protein
MKKIVCSSLVFIYSIIIANWSNSYNSIITHPRLTEVAIEVFQKKTNIELSSDQKSYIIQGSINEDALPRPLNHFYNPATGLGLEGAHKSAKEWALNGGWSGASGDFSERAILENYQNGNKDRAYEGIGHIVHLIQDMSVPAHVRNNPHELGDIFEVWAQNLGKVVGENNSYIEVDNLGLAFNELATFTHDNFLSKDTVDQNFLVNIDDIKKDDEKDEYTYYYKNGYHLALVNKNRPTPILYFENNNKINQDYWNQLSPKAIGYSAGIIGYFQNKFNEIDEKKKQQTSQSFLSTGLDILATIWHNTNYNFSDVMGSVAMQETVDGTVSGYNKTVEKANAFTQNTINKANDIIQTVNTVSPVAIKKPKVLGVKIVASSTPDVFIVVDETAPVVAEVGTKEEGQTKANAEQKITDVIKPVSASELIDPNLAAPIRTTPIPTFDSPVNSEPFNLPEPIVYPETQILSQPLTIGNSPLAIFAFGSDQASSSYEFTLGPVSSTTVWISAGPVITLEKLTDGPHSLFVRAVYKAVSDQTPAEYSWVIDTVAPSSQFASLDKYYNQSSFPISWSRTDSGTDEPYFNIDFATSTGEWVAYEHATTATSTLFAGNVQPGETVGFRVQACDVLGNCEPLATSSQSATRVGPVMPSTTTLALVSASGQGAQVTWNTPNDANLELATTAQYGLKYQVKNGSCNFAANWEAASSSTGLPTPQITAGGAESFTLSNLSAGTAYCAAVRAYNGANWSELSNVLEFRTNCNDTTPRATNYTTHISKASTSSVPNQTPESILVVDYTNHIINYIYKGMIMVDFGVYNLYGSNTCGQIAERAIGFNDPASTMTRVELVYDPETKLFTGQYRQCENGWHYLMQFDGDRCRDLANGWASRRWYTNPNLQGQSMVSLQRTRTGQFTEWLKIP